MMSNTAPTWQPSARLSFLKRLPITLTNIKNVSSSNCTSCDNYPLSWTSSNEKLFLEWYSCEFLYIIPVIYMWCKCCWRCLYWSLEVKISCLLNATLTSQKGISSHHSLKLLVLQRRIHWMGCNANHHITMALYYSYNDNYSTCFHRLDTQM